MASNAPAFARNHLIRVRQVDRTIDQQLRLSSPRVTQRVNPYGNPTGTQANVMPGLGGLAPRSVGDLSAIGSIAL